MCCCPTTDMNRSVRSTGLLSPSVSRSSCAGSPPSGGAFAKARTNATTTSTRRSRLRLGGSTGRLHGASSRTVLGFRSPVSTRALAENNEVLESVLDIIRTAEARRQEPNFYDLLGIKVGAEPKEIKKAYRNRARSCHPDLAGEDGHEACIVLNEAYATLMDDDLRQSYEVEQEDLDFYEEGNPFAEAMKETPYTGEPLSKTVGLDHFANKLEKDDLEKQAEQIQKAVFVDENSCIGCMLCVNCASATFRVDEEHGRARVFGQWLSDEEEIQTAIDVCPVDCIHWVTKEQLPVLEYTQQHILTERLGVAMMMAGQGDGTADVFQKSKEFLKFLTQREEKKEMLIRERKRKEERRKAREEMQRNAERMKAQGDEFWRRANGKV